MKMASKMRLAIVVSHPIQHFVPQYHSLRKSSNFQVSVLFGSDFGQKQSYDSGFGRDIQWSGMNLDELDHIFLSQKQGHSTRVALETTLDQIDPDIVVIYGYANRLSRLSHSWAKRRGVPMAYISDTDNRRRRKFSRRKLVYPYIRNFLQDIQFFMTVGDSNEAVLRSFGISDLRMIRTSFPIDIASYSKAYGDTSIRAEVRNDLGLSDDAFLVLNVGKLIERKRQQDLIGAVSAMKGKSASPEIHVALVGSGIEEQKLQSLVSELGLTHRVKFLGFTDPAKLPGLYLAADCYAHTAEMEPHSLAISEAMYCGLPIVLSENCGSWGPTDDVRNGANGWVYPPGDIERLSHFLQVLATNVSLRKSMGALSRSIALENQNSAHSTAWDVLHNRLTYQYR